MYEIRVQPFDATFECEEDETVLDAALRAKLFLRYGCKHGGCGTCKVQLVDGEVDLTASAYSLPPAEQDAGTILVCQSYPLDDCEIDVSAMNLDEDEFRAGDGSATYRMTIEEIEKLTRDIRRVRLRHRDGARMPFTAGQFVNLVVPGTEHVRTYSMANGSADSTRIELLCKILPGGAFSEFLETTATPGAELNVSGPYGMMKVRVSHRDIVMVAGGSGLAPLLSMLTDLAERRSDRTIALFFGARSAQDLYALEEIAELGQRLPGLTFVPVLVEPEDPSWTGPTGLVTDAICAGRDSYEGCDAYLCGPPGMIDAVTELLVTRGVRPQNIYYDAFVPTGNATV
jgi:propane monooxygenase reductase subunit